MGLDRRSFLRFAAGAGVGIVATPILWQTIDDVAIWTQNWPWIPRNQYGENTYVSTTSKLCPSACGIKVRLVNGRPVRTLSSQEHPLGGGISALAAAEVQLLYSPARLRTPLLRKSDGAHVQITWEEAEALLLKKLTEAGKNIACVSGDETGSSLNALSAFMSARGSSSMFLMPSDAQAASRAWQLMGGSGQLAYDLEGCDLVLAIGANVLESWGTFIKNRKVFAATHPHGGTPSMRMLYAGPMMNNTAAVADQRDSGASGWIPMRSGTEGAFALGIAAQLIMNGRSVNTDDFMRLKEALADYTPAKIEALTGVKPDALKEIVAMLLRAKKPLVIVGSECGQGGGAIPVMAGVAVNMLLGSYGADGSLKSIPLSTPLLAGDKTRTEIYKNDFVSFINSNTKPQLLMVYEANPAYALPDPEKTSAYIKSVPFKVAFTQFLDETALLCDLVLPTPMGLERMDDVESPYGCSNIFYSLTHPVVPPVMHKVKHGIDVLLTTAAKLKLNNLPATYEAILRAKANNLGADYNALLGGTVLQKKSLATPRPGDGTGRNISLRPDLLLSALTQKQLGAAFMLAPVRKIAMGTAQSGIPPFNVKTIRANELSGTEMHVFINAATAKYSHDLKRNDRIKITAGEHEIYARVTYFEGIAPDTIGIPMGFGHTALDEFSRNKGANLAELLTASIEPGTGLTLWNQIGVNFTKA